MFELLPYLIISAVLFWALLKAAAISAHGEPTTKEKSWAMMEEYFAENWQQIEANLFKDSIMKQLFKPRTETSRGQYITFPKSDKHQGDN